ncbi:MAG: hypothetical protein U0N38_03720 [Acutalibacteraceae bacterium]
MKKIIALLLALAMIFAFAACKGKDDNKDTTADSTQGAGADVQDTQAGGEDTTAAEAPSGDSTEAPSEGGSEAATQGQQGGSQGGKPSPEGINAPVNGSKADIVAFFNKYATAMKQYKGKVTVKRVQGTTSKINSITGGSAIANIAQPLLPNDYPQTATQTFNGGKAADGTTLASFLPASKRAAYNVNPAGVKSASCVKQGNGWKVSITLIVESGEGLTFVPTHHGSCFDTLSLTKDSFGPFEPVSTKVNYQSGTFTFVLNADGTLASINVTEPANVVCKLKKGISIDADFTGTWKQDFTFTY